MLAPAAEGRPDGFPEELCVLPQWLCWKEVPREGKPTKVPVSPCGGEGKSNDPATWGTLREALAYLERRPEISGVGFVFSEDDPYCGVDLDGCRDPETGALEPWAAEIVAALGSYSEASPSGTGVHIIARGKLPPGRRGWGDGHFLADAGRFFTMTGELLDGAPAEIGDRQAEIEALHRRLFPPIPAAPAVRNGRQATSPPELSDDELLRRARTAGNGAKFARLWAGDRSGYPSDSETDLALCDLLAFWTSDEGQVDRLFRRSGLYREKWERADYRERTIRKAIEDRAERWGGGAAVVPLNRRVAGNDGRNPADGGGAPPLETDYNLTDLGNAERFADAHGGDVLWVERWRFWVVWDGKRWARDWTREVHRRAELTVRSIYADASKVEESERRKAIANHAKRSESATRVREMLELAKAKTWATPEEFDRDNYLLTVANGTLDLRTGELREHRREDRITKLADVPYDPDAKAPIFERFLGRIMPSEEVRAFLQRAAGYSATGDASERALFINHGTGDNGKSTLQEVLAAALGEYAMAASADTFLAKRPGTIPNDVARLKGARYVRASETGEGRRLDEALIKSMTGNEEISARHLYGESFDFKPTHKIWLSTNHKPEIRGTDNGIWNRIRFVPFAEKITEKEKDPKLPEKLKGELPGVLAWIVRGAIAWWAGGLQAPEAVRAATSEYREEMDTLAAFVSECCVEGQNHSVQAKPLYDAYTGWCEENGERYEKSKRFYQQLIERGYEKDKDGRGRVRYYGLALRPKDDDPGGLLNTPPEPPEDDAPPLGDGDAPPPPPSPDSELRTEAPMRGGGTPTEPGGAVSASEEPGRTLTLESPSEAVRDDPGASGGPSSARSPAPDETATETPAETSRPRSENDTRKADNEAESVSVRAREELRKPWAIQQLALIRAGRDNLINPTANTVAIELFGAPHRWREVLPFVEQALGRGRNDAETA